MLPPFFEGIISWSGYRCNPCFPHGVEKNCLACGKGPLAGPGNLPGAGCPPGGGGPPGGACPAGVRLPAAGAKTISFSTEKETVLDSKEKDGAGLRWVFGRPRRLASLHTVWGPAPAVTAMPLGNREKTMVLSCGRLAVPLSWQSAVARWGRHALHRSPAPPQRKHLTTPALREAPAGGGWVGLTTFPYFTEAGRNGRKGSRSHTKAASRRFLPETCRRPGPSFSLG